MRNNFGLITILALIVVPSIGKTAHAQPSQFIYKDGPQLKITQPKPLTLFQDAIKARDEKVAHDKEVVRQREIARGKALQRQKEEQAALQQPAPQPSSVSSGYVPQVYNPSSVQSMIIHWAGVYGVSSDWMLKIANCESSFDPSNQYLGHLGLYQYLPETFASYSASAGVSGSIWDADTQAHVTAWALANGHAGAWTCA